MNYLELSNIPATAWTNPLIEIMASLLSSDERVESFTILPQKDNLNRPLAQINAVTDGDALKGCFSLGRIAGQLECSPQQVLERKINNQKRAASSGQIFTRNNILSLKQFSDLDITLETLYHTVMNKEERTGLPKIYWVDPDNGEEYKIIITKWTGDTGYSLQGSLDHRHSIQLNGNFFEGSTSLGSIIANIAGFSSYAAFKKAVNNV